VPLKSAAQHPEPTTTDETGEEDPSVVGKKQKFKEAARANLPLSARGKRKGKA